MNIRFKEDTHQYLSDKGELTSVSKFVKQFEEEKDWVEIAKKKSRKLKREGINKSHEELLKEWERKKDLGTYAGTLAHEMKELERLSGAENVKHSGFKGEDKYSFDLSTLENGWIYPELMVYDFEHMICGQSDEVQIINNSIDIIDYKTDKEIKFKAFSSEFTKPEKLLPPLEHLDNCNGVLYSLKMSLYMYMVWKQCKGIYKPGKIILKWCPIERDEDGIPILYDGKPKIMFEKDIEVPYRKKEVLKMLECTRK